MARKSAIHHLLAKKSPRSQEPRSVFAEHVLSRLLNFIISVNLPCLSSHQVAIHCKAASLEIQLPKTFICSNCSHLPVSTVQNCSNSIRSQHFYNSQCVRVFRIYIYALKAVLQFKFTIKTITCRLLVVTGHLFFPRNYLKSSD